MNKVTLKVRTSEFPVGIYPVTTNSEHRRLELRARTVLAYGYESGKIKPFVSVVDDKTNLVLLDVEETEVLDNDEYAWPISHDVNSGCIYVAETMAAGWDQQPGRLLLYIDNTLNVDQVLRQYFQASLRWLDDNRGYAKAALDKLYGKSNR